MHSLPIVTDLPLRRISNMAKRRSAICEIRAMQRQAGMSLVELMIAMVLGLILTFGVIQIFTAASQTYRLTDRVGQLQEDMRFILGRLQIDGRMAGHDGCLVGDPNNNLNVSATGLDSIVYGNRPLTGWEASDTGLEDDLDLSTEITSPAWANGTGDALPLATATSTIKGGTDFFIINGAERTNAVLNGIPASGNVVNTDGASGIDQGAIVLLVTANCLAGDLLQKTSNDSATNIAKGTMTGFTPGNTTPGFNPGLVYNNNATAYEYNSTLYYIGTGTSGEPGLFRQRLSDDGASAQELVSGVESMQVLYGVSQPTGRPRATRYVTAGNVTSWDDVVSMRIGLLMRSANPVQDEAAARVFNLLGTQITTEEDRRARLLGTTTIAIRNSLQ